MSFSRQMHTIASHLGVVIAVLLLGSVWSNSARGDDCSFRVGWAPYEPFQISDEKGGATGLDVEIFEHIVADSGCSIAEYREAPWTRLLIEVEQGRVDVVLSASFTEERDAFGYYTESHRAVRYVGFVHTSQAIPQRVQTINEILSDDPIIGTYRNAYLPPFVAEEVEKAALANRVILADSYDKLFDLLTKDRLGVVISEVADITVNFDKAESDDNIQGIEIEGSEDKVHFLFSRKTTSPDTVARISAQVTEFVKTDDYRALFRKYLGK